MTKQALKQVVAEPFEILKTAKDQVAGSEKQENFSQEENSNVYQQENPKSVEEQVLKQKLEAQGQRQIRALEEEIKVIQDIQGNKKIENIVAEEKKKQAAAKGKPPLVEPTTKQSRNILAFIGRLTKKALGLLGVKRQQRQTETAKSPTG